MAEQEPVAWLYTGGGHRPETSVRRFNDETRRRFNRTETPLYAAPPALAEQNVALVEALVDALERVAKMVEKRRDDRFAEYGMTDPDTNASHYPGRYGETREALDEECEEIAMAIRATIRKEPLDG